MIYASFKAHGPLEKPDVIGAVFGQTEGLLGSELEMRELQKEGKIGRIEVELEVVDGKSIGEIQIPTALDKSETTLIAAALETIDKIGPTEAEVQIDRIQDVRADKRDFIVERAKKLMESIEGGGDLGNMAKDVKEGTRIARIQEYGEEKLPAGDISGDEIIVVEGRADVINLLKNRVNNVIGMDGTKLPREIAKLGEEKELTLFIDGDRGGKLIANNVINNAKIKYVATAPDGKEVEELAGKEILIALRRKIPASEFSNGKGFNSEPKRPEFEGDVKEKVKKIYDKIRGTKRAVLVDSNFDVIREISPKELSRSIQNMKRDIFAVVIDGSVNSAILKACEEKNIKHVGATNFASGIGETNIELISL